MLGVDYGHLGVLALAHGQICSVSGCSCPIPLVFLSLYSPAQSLATRHECTLYPIDDF